MTPSPDIGKRTMETTGYSDWAWLAAAERADADP
jgi:hypothetical protein